MSKRRSQDERRQETIGKLIGATIEAVAECGYARASTGQICERAGVSQGGLFNHFSTRLELIVAATEHIANLHLQRFAMVPEDAAAAHVDIVPLIVELIRGTARSPNHAAWHEFMVAARTDRALRERVREPLRRFEQGLLETAKKVLGIDDQRMERMAVVILSVAHMFDSEAVTQAVYANDSIEAARIAWATDLIRTELLR